MSISSRNKESNQRAEESAKMAQKMLTPAQSYAIAAAGANLKDGVWKIRICPSEMIQQRLS